jgi:diguanylate cyclase (GGDEF)-like protein
LPETNVRDAAEIAEQVRKAVMQLSLDTPISPGYVTISAGCATSVREGMFSSDQLLAAADAAMYRAKTAGRNQVQHATVD